MTILQVFKDYFPPTHGGIEHHVHDIAHLLRGFRVEVLTSSRSPRAVIDADGPVRVVRAPEYGRFGSTPITPAWFPFLRHDRFGLIHVHMPNPVAELALLVARRSAPIVVTYHADVVGWRLGPAYRWLQRRFLHRAVRIIVSSPVMLDTSATLRGHGDRALVIPYGVAPDYWRPRPSAADAVRTMHRPPLVLFLGRLVHYKGVGVLIEAMRDVDATLIIVGDGPERPSLERAAARAGIGHKVVFVGAVPNDVRLAYYHAADVFALPATSRSEAFGIAMLEAMACGTPVVSTELGTATSWVNRCGETGLVVPPGNPAQLASGLRRLLEDDTLRLTMGAAAARRVQDHFGRDAMLDALGSVYRAVARPGGR